ncbi:CPBP family intramembrane glutamic endopeptidase [Dethiothermospora halolimnae]|uniref:CPBP family intramembrane glutamic endopeptidase n=1 Tax=Dethiothermospora halolimnae TaxID=3114390 RepID=UPI003CCBA53D
MRPIYRVNFLVLLIILLRIVIGMLRLPIPINMMNIISQYLTLFMPVIIFILITKKDFKKTLSLSKLKLSNIPIIILIAVVMQPFLTTVSLIASSIVGDQVSGIIESATTPSFFLTLFGLAITPAICEEFLLRGVILDGYRGKTIKKAAIMNGILFGILHMNFHQFAYTFFLGVLLAYIVYITGSILSSILIHFINNGTAVLGAHFINTGGSEVSKEVVAEGVRLGYANIVVAAISLFLTLSLVKLLIKINKKDMSKVYSKYKKDYIFNLPLFLLIIVFIGLSILSMTL